MERKSSRWRFLNPMETLRAIYEAFGTPYPRLSLIIGMILSAGAFAAVWISLGKQVEKNHGAASTQANPPIVINQEATDSDCSNVTAGKDATVNCPPSTENKNAAPSAPQKH